MADDTSAAAAPVEPARRRRRLVGLLLTLAVVTGLIGVFAVWVNRQALNTDNWTRTSGQLLANPQIEQAVAAYTVSQLFGSVDVAAELQRGLPKQLSALAGPVAAGLQSLAGQVALRLLAAPATQAAWRQANRTAHEELLKVIDGGGAGISTSNGVVTLNLHALVDQLANALGIESQLAALRAKLGAVPVPAQSGQLVIMRSRQLKTVQDVAKAIRGLAVVFTIIPLLLLALAIWFADGWRRIVLRRSGWCFVGLGLVLLIARKLIEHRVIDALVASPSVRPAADAAWLIGSSLLRDIAFALVGYGVVLAVAAMLAGPTRLATTIRRVLAFDLRERPGVAYGVLAGALLLLLVWGPTPAFRQLSSMLVLIALLVLGLELLRRQTAREFPDARAGEASRTLGGWIDRSRDR
jgi:hypothetical protein